MPIPAKVQGQDVWDCGEPSFIQQFKAIHEIWNFTFNIRAQNHCNICAMNFQKTGLSLYYIQILAAWLGFHFSIFAVDTGGNFFLQNTISCEMCQKQIFHIGFKNIYMLPKLLFWLNSSTGTFMGKLIHHLISERQSSEYQRCFKGGRVNLAKKINKYVGKIHNVTLVWKEISLSCFHSFNKIFLPYSRFSHLETLD